MTDVDYHSAVTTSDAISYLTNQSAAQSVWLTPQSLIGRLTGLYKSPDPVTGIYTHDTD